MAHHVPVATTSAKPELDGVLRRLGLEDMQSKMVDGSLPGIDLKASDDYRAERAVRQGLDPATATWQEITQVANARARTALGLPPGASVYAIVQARRALYQEVSKAYAAGTLNALDSKNPEISYAIERVTKAAPEKSP